MRVACRWVCYHVSHSSAIYEEARLPDGLLRISVLLLHQRRAAVDAWHGGWWADRDAREVVARQIHAALQ